VVAQFARLLQDEIEAESPHLKQGGDCFHYGTLMIADLSRQFVNVEIILRLHYYHLLWTMVSFAMPFFRFKSLKIFQLFLNPPLTYYRITIFYCFCKTLKFFIFSGFYFLF